MKKKILNYSAVAIKLPLVCLMLVAGSCQDFVKIDPPRTELVTSTVFTNDLTADAAVVNIYYKMSASGFASGNILSVSFLTSLLSDEYIDYILTTPQNTIEYQQFNDNTLNPNNSLVLSLWSEGYQHIYEANAVLQGLASSTGVSDTLKKQLQGEAKFIRAFFHFYLVNLFGNIPLVTITDYKLNAVSPRIETSKVYDQIIADLIDAQTLLPADYSFAGDQRVRATKGAATALLARTYLYRKDWPNAQAQASLLLENNSLYSLAPNLTEVFRTTSPEAILQLWSEVYPQDRDSFSVSHSGPDNGAMRQEYADTFEPGDLRKQTWIFSRIVAETSYTYALKYYSFDSPPLDFTTVLRLAEQYLIRAEARAQSGDFAGSQSDLNALRSRAGLEPTSANDQQSLLLAVEAERKAELFTEWGHRWFDLARTGRADAILKPLKANWVSTAILCPIPEYELKNNPALANSQNPGY